ncbi:unnamed protein product, partial [Leptidea sinapis]
VFCRTSLPVAQFSRGDFSLWSVLKNCVGKELSKITMPVVFNEPLSFLQRMLEYLEYASLLRIASEQTDPVARMECIAGFPPPPGVSVSRRQPALRVPRVSSSQTEVLRKKWGEAYTWSNVNCCVHNVIVGKLWIEQYGSMEVTCHGGAGLKANLCFKPAGFNNRDLHRVEGFITDPSKKRLRFLYGKWTQYIKCCSASAYEQWAKDRGEEAGTQQTPKKVLAKLNSFKVGALRSMSIQDFYQFTEFSMSLNEMQRDMKGELCPTDSRLRPDVRLLEQGDIDGAAAEKTRLEEKQRAARKALKKSTDAWQPRY